MVRDAALIGAAGLLAAGAWLLYRNAQTEADQMEAEADQGGGAWMPDPDTVLTDASQTTAELIDSITSSTMRLSNMSRVTAQDVAHPNVRALLAVIRRGEGTAGPNGYRTLFGGGLFEGYADHPRQRITRTLGGRPITSTAAGAYQFLSSTWDETRRIMGLTDFTPASQDRAAVGRIAARGALDDAKAGRLDVALRKIAREWASMPGSPYGQPVITEQTARTVYASAGGSINA